MQDEPEPLAMKAPTPIQEVVAPNKAPRPEVQREDQPSAKVAKMASAPQPPAPEDRYRNEVDMQIETDLRPFEARFKLFDNQPQQPQAPVAAPAAPKPTPPPQPKPAPVVAPPQPKPTPVVAPPQPKPAPVVAPPQPKPAPVVAPQPKPAPVAAPPSPKPKPVHEQPLRSKKRGPTEERPYIEKTKPTFSKVIISISFDLCY